MDAELLPALSKFVSLRAQRSNLFIRRLLRRFAPRNDTRLISGEYFIDDANIHNLDTRELLPRRQQDCSQAITAHVSRLTLGTVQFGLDYGIANPGGKIPPGETFKILNLAADWGIHHLDTAGDYGDSERLIGEFTVKEKKSFHIVSKFSLPENGDSRQIEKLLRQSLKNLGTGQLYGYLVHRFSDFKMRRELWDHLSGLRSRGLVKKIGFSLYSPGELELLLEKKVDFDIVQVPYSIFDRRFEKYFPALKKKGVETQARSIFLQGLAFMSPDDLPGSLQKAQKQLKVLRAIVNAHDLSINAVCLCFALLNPYVDRVLNGVDSLAHLKENIAAISLIKRVKDISVELNDLVIEDENILLPYKWAGRTP